MPYPRSIRRSCAGTVYSLERDPCVYQWRENRAQILRSTVSIVEEHSRLLLLPRITQDHNEDGLYQRIFVCVIGRLGTAEKR